MRVWDEAFVECLPGYGAVEVEGVREVFCCGETFELFVEGFDLRWFDCQG